MMRCAKFKAIIVNQGTTSKPLDACKAGTASHVYTKSSQVGLRSWSQCANSNSSMPWRFWAHPCPAGWLNVELICTQLILSHGLWNLHNSLSWGLNLKLMSLTTRVVACLWPQDAKKSGCAHVRLCWYLTMELDCNFMVIYMHDLVPLQWIVHFVEIWEPGFVPGGQICGPGMVLEEKYPGGYEREFCVKSCGHTKCGRDLPWNSWISNF